MPRFYVRVSGDDLDRAKARLVTAGIPTESDAPGYWESDKPPPPPGASAASVDELKALVDAESGDEAERQVRAVLPAAAGYAVEAEAGQ